MYLDSQGQEIKAGKYIVLAEGKYYGNCMFYIYEAGGELWMNEDGDGGFYCLQGSSNDFCKNWLRVDKPFQWVI